MAAILWLVALGMHMIDRRSPGLDREGRSFVGLMSVLAVVSFGFFFFYAGVVRERYMLFGLAFVAVVLSQGAIALGRSIPRLNSLATPVRSVGLVVVLGFWLSVNQSVAQPLQGEREIQSRLREHIVTVVRSLSEGENCRGVSRWSAPAIQVGSGCTFAPRFTPQSAREFALEARDHPGALFVVWPGGNDLDLPGDWDVIEISADDPKDRSMSIYYNKGEA